MCGRFLLDSHIQKIMRTYKIEDREIEEYDRGHFYPSQNAPLVVQDKKRTLKFGKWGYSLTDNKRLVINARAESIMNKPMFKSSIYTSRCIIPANLFYEWKDEGYKTKVKYGIRLKDNNLISLGGIYKEYIDENLNRCMNFVIITTHANNSIKDIHWRMPLLIKDEFIDYWLNNNTPIEIIEEILESNGDDEFVVERYEDESKKDIDKDYQQLRMF